MWDPPADGGELPLRRRGLAIIIFPQHVTEPSNLKPQVWWNPALTEANSPSGGVAWPSWALPQQATEPATLTPQLWLDPALTDENFPSSGVASPSAPVAWPSPPHP